MKRISSSLFSILGIFSVFITVSSASQAKVKNQNASIKVIYGADDRHDVYQVDSPALKAIADSTAAMIPNEQLQANQDGSYAIHQKVFGEDYGLCHSEPFYDQPNAAMCSGFLVGPDLLATAGHCVNTFTCSGNSFVFNYKMKDAQTPPSVMNHDDVYFCKEVVAREQTRDQDYALVRLDRSVVGRMPLGMANKAPSPGDSLVMIGHPSGLPTKIAGGANVRRVEHGFFVANTDSYGGNSGSAVFNANTLEVVGILVRGEQDFAFDYQNQCTKSNYCKDDECRGEDVTLIEYIVNNMPH